MPADMKPAAAKEPTHWVILHERVGRFEQGKVIPKGEFPTGVSFPDLMRLGAVRPADVKEIMEGSVEIDPFASREARQKEVSVLKTQIDLLEKELAFYKDENSKIKAVTNPAGNPDPSPGVKKLIETKDAAIADLSAKLSATENERAKLAKQNDELQQALEAVTKPAADKKEPERK